jgi:hypothetical protein
MPGSTEGTRGLREVALRKASPDYSHRPALAEAIALYRSAGYREAPVFNDEPFAHHWFQKELPEDAPAAGREEPCRIEPFGGLMR